MPNSVRQERINFRTIAVWALTVVTVGAVAILLWKLAHVLLLAFGGVLVAIFFRTLAHGVAQYTRFGEGWSLAIVLVAIAALSAAGVYFGGKAIATQMTELAEEIPRSLEKLREDVTQYEWGSWLVKHSPDSPENMPISGQAVTSYVSKAVSSVTGGMAAMIIVIFLSLYLAFDPSTYEAGVIRLVPVEQRERTANVLGEVHETLEWWLIGKIASMLLVGMLTYVGLLLIGVPLALALSVIAALLTFVPNFGPIISAVPAMLLAFVSSPTTAAYVALLYLAIQTVESYLITPLIQQKTVSLPPALTISAQVAMGILLGAGGVVLATPLTAAGLVLVKRLYVEDVLEAGQTKNRS